MSISTFFRTRKNSTGCSSLRRERSTRRENEQASSASAKTTLLSMQRATATFPFKTMPLQWSMNWRNQLTTRNASPSDIDRIWKKL